jgi:hypothetical protein
VRTSAFWPEAERAARRLAEAAIAEAQEGGREAERRQVPAAWQRVVDRAPGKAAVDAARLMILIGWRRGAMLDLRWAEIDVPRRTARLVDTMTGASLRRLSNAACGVIKAQPKDRRCGVRQSIR